MQIVVHLTKKKKKRMQSNHLEFYPNGFPFFSFLKYIVNNIFNNRDTDSSLFEMLFIYLIFQKCNYKKQRKQ